MVWLTAQQRRQIDAAEYLIGSLVLPTTQLFLWSPNLHLSGALVRELCACFRGLDSPVLMRVRHCTGSACLAA